MSRSHPSATDEVCAVPRPISAIVEGLSETPVSAGLHVVLNLSEFGQSLQAAGYTMSSASWQPEWNQYLSFIASRTNTVTGVKYGSDPTIAMVELWGEIPAPNLSNPVGTAAQMQGWYSATTAEWHSLAPNILVSSGGFSYLNKSGAAGIPWQQIMRDPNNATCDMEIHSIGDRDVTTPMVTKYCQGIGKPWFLSAWSSCLKPPRSSTDLDGYATDAQMATHAAAMYAIASGHSPATHRALGADFWNLGPATTNTCQLGNREVGRRSGTAFDDPLVTSADERLVHRHPQVPSSDRDRKGRYLQPEVQVRSFGRDLESCLVGACRSGSWSV